MSFYQVYCHLKHSREQSLYSACVLVHHLLDNIDDSSLAKNKQTKKKNTTLQTKWQEMLPQIGSGLRTWS